MNWSSKATEVDRKEPTLIKSKETVMAEGHNRRRGDRDDYKKVAIIDTWKATCYV